MLTGEHSEMLEAVRDRDVERADALAHARTRQFRDNFVDFMSKNYASGIDLGRAAKRAASAEPSAALRRRAQAAEA